MLFATAVIWRALALHDLQPLISFYGAIGARWHLPEATLRHFAGTQLPAYLGHFALGVLCGRAWLANKGAIPSRLTATFMALVAISALLGLYAVFAGGAPWLGEQAWVVIPIALATAIWATVSRRPKWGHRVLSIFPLIFIGRVSYSMYLYHLPVIYLFGQYAPPLGGLAFPCYFGIITGVSTLSFYLVERPFMQTRPRTTSRSPTVATV